MVSSPLLGVWAASATEIVSKILVNVATLTSFIVLATDGPFEPLHTSTN